MCGIRGSIMSCAVPLLLALIALGGAGFSAAQFHDDGLQALNLLRLLSENPRMVIDHWDRLPRIVEDLVPNTSRQNPAGDDDTSITDDGDDSSRWSSDKRSAVATALNSGRRRRQPAPALGKAAKPFIGVGVLGDMDIFFDSLRDNLETVASLSPYERSSLFRNPPTVVNAPTSTGGGGGSGMRRLHALRPLRPTGNIRSYNRRSDLQTYSSYPSANRHDPGLLWTGLGR